MPIAVNAGVPIATGTNFSANLSDALPKPQVDIVRSAQREDAWCYAACASMVINFCLEDQFTSQCEVASFAKDNNCCDSEISACTDSGCSEDQIGPIYTRFGVDYEGFDPNDPTHPVEIGRISFADILESLSADPPRPIEAVIEWNGTLNGSSHAVLIIGAHGDSVYLVDPLPGSTYGEWQDFESLQQWFGHGRWVRSWPGLRRK